MDVRLGWPMWVGIVVDDVKAARAFYRDTLGFAETVADEDWVQFDLGGNQVELLGRSSLPPSTALGYQVSFAVEDIEAARAELLAAGVAPIGEIESSSDGRYRWCEFRDPEGNVFGITHRYE
jgi:catechol 2,3-dioxygenase-like lactoylglutathione lyase family enzyme